MSELMTSGENAPQAYLCQVNPNVSCGACCGLYNVGDPSPENLTAILTRRTRWFVEVPRNVAGIDAFKAGVESAEPQARPFPDFHHCAFLGMIEDDGRRVGCLLHPLAEGNQGLDWRGLSYYGGMACRTYFCPSVRRLPVRWLTAIRQCMTDWYLHGLVVTERWLLTGFFTALEKRIGRRIRENDFIARSSAEALKAAMTFMKCEWPFRRKDAPGVCNYFFEDGRHERPIMETYRRTIPTSRFEAIFRELDTGFASVKQMAEAEGQIEALLTGLCTTLSTTGRTSP